MISGGRSTAHLLSTHVADPILNNQRERERERERWVWKKENTEIQKCHHS
jgi:hypothetical protein